MKYLPLFKLWVTHPYYSDRRCPDFEIAASVETQRLLRNHRCVQKTQEDGFTILMVVDEEDRPFIPLASDAVFSFDLRLHNQVFAYFTDLSDFSGNTAPLFSNMNLSVGENRLPLSAGPAASTDASVAALGGPGVFAQVHIANNDSLPAKGEALSDVPLFQIDFKAKEARWTYYCVTNLSEALGELTIEDKSTTDSEPLIFSIQNRTEFDDASDLGDEVALLLNKQYPDFRKIRFLSDEVVACRQAARSQIAFYMGENRLSEALPNPSFKNNATLSTVEGSIATEETLFQVIKYLSV